jgi:hypothetical protein
MKGRVDGAQIIPGYLSTRGESIDMRYNDTSYYMSATQEKISAYKLVEYEGSYAFFQSSNSNGMAENFYIVAITSNISPLHADG